PSTLPIPPDHQPLFCNQRWHAWLGRQKCPASGTHQAKAIDQLFSCRAPARPQPSQIEHEETSDSLCARRRDSESIPSGLRVKILGFLFLHLSRWVVFSVYFWPSGPRFSPPGFRRSDPNAGNWPVLNPLSPSPPGDNKPPLMTAAMPER